MTSVHPMEHLAKKLSEMREAFTWAGLPAPDALKFDDPADTARLIFEGEQYLRENSASVRSAGKLPDSIAGFRIE